jgi:hypothetical protein
MLEFLKNTISIIKSEKNNTHTNVYPQFDRPMRSCGKSFSGSSI